MIAKKYQNGTYTVLNPASGEIVVLQESRETALELGVPAGVLDTVVSDSDWRVALMTCTTATAVVCKEALENAASSEEVREKFAAAMAAVTAVASDMAEQQRQTEIKILREFLQSEYARLCIAHGHEPDATGQAMFWDHLNNHTKVGRRLKLLEAK